MFMLVLAFVLVLVINLPFGYWRGSTRKFSLAWVIAIHLPVPLVAGVRVFSGIGWELYTYPILIAAFFLGQYLGKRLYAAMAHGDAARISGCLVMDIWRQIRASATS